MTSSRAHTLFYEKLILKQITISVAFCETAAKKRKYTHAFSKKKRCDARWVKDSGGADSVRSGADPLCGGLRVCRCVARVAPLAWLFAVDSARGK